MPRRDFLKLITATVGGAAATAFFEGCGIQLQHLPKEKTLAPPDRTEMDQEMEALRPMFEGMDVYREIAANPEIRLSMRFNPELAKQNMLGTFQPDTNLGGEFTGSLELLPLVILAPEDKDAFESTAYHELVHAKQSYQLWQYYMVPEKNILPEWKMRFYYANIPKEESYHLGGELEAHYLQAKYEHGKTQQCIDGTLSGFFSYYLKIQRSSAWEKYEEVRTTATRMYEEIVVMTGETPDSLIARMRQAKAKPEPR